MGYALAEPQGAPLDGPARARCSRSREDARGANGARHACACALCQAPKATRCRQCTNGTRCLAYARCPRVPFLAFPQALSISTEARQGHVTEAERGATGRALEAST